MVENSSPNGQGGGTAVLCSAGLDSAVLLAAEALRGPVVPVYVGSGLAWETDERRMLAELVAAPPLRGHVATPEFLEFSARGLYPSTHWAVAGSPPAFDTPDEDVYLVGRNVVLLSRAGVLCAQRSLRRIVLGILGGNPFPDATAEFFSAMERALSLGLGHELTIDAPFRGKDKTDVIRLGRQLAVPFELTLSCMSPRNGQHCGQCSKCRERHDAFVDVEMSDPTVYASVLPR
jgi:7-cyano-7-deazaguanine synthase